MTDKANEGRRRFLRTVPAAVAGAVAAPVLAQQAAQAPRLGKDTLECAEKIFGVDFTDAQEEALARGVSRNLESFEALRKVDIPLDTDVPLEFRPYLPGDKPKPGATPGARIDVTLTPAPRRASLDDLAFEPITALAPLLRNRQVSATDLTKMYLARLETYGPKLNCIVTLTKDLALEQAAAADREIRAGRYRGPLHGIPWGAKDLFATKGIPTTWGAGPYQNQVIDYDATVVTRLREAGAVLVAKLALGALAQGDRWFRGQTKNPWRPDDPNPARSGSSGSSAGPGSATAAGLVGFAIGTETRGSIMSPSSVNGVTGLRPTYGRVSRYGAMMLSWTMDKVGPMCRSVEDCALVFNAIYGPDGKDDSVVDAPFAWTPKQPLSQLRVGYIVRDFEMPAAGGRGGAPGGGRGGANAEEFRRQREAQLAVLKAALDVYRKLGVNLLPIEDVPGSDLANDIGFVLSVEAAAAFDDLTRSEGIEDPSVQQWAGTFRTSRFVPAVEYIRAQRARTLLMRQWHELMSRYDVFLAPATGSTLGITNLTGNPAVAFKAGFNDGAPVELSVTGRLYDEATILRVALAYERATPWHTMNPTVNW
jgi:Asp-tRNA(Asn)/Glu-tRNA(Gln) amidotransferase A subunit family amidase